MYCASQRAMQGLSILRPLSMFTVRQSAAWQLTGSSGYSISYRTLCLFDCLRNLISAFIFCEVSPLALCDSSIGTEVVCSLDEVLKDCPQISRCADTRVVNKRMRPSVISF